MLTLPFSLGHRDGGTMVALSHWAQGIVTFQAGAADHVLGVDAVFKAHIALGLTIFLLFPFSRLVHIWSAPVSYPGLCARAGGHGASGWAAIGFGCDP